jgi:hypothetical protein
MWSACPWCAACSGHQHLDDKVKLGADSRKGEVKKETVCCGGGGLVVVAAWKKA